MAVKTLLVSAILAASTSASKAAESPDFGPHVHLFDPSMPSAAIQKQIDDVYAVQHDAQFGEGREAFLFAPGDYKVDIGIGYTTQVLGLGNFPDDVRIAGTVHADASLPNNNATCNFWEGVEGFSIAPSSGPVRWAVSQASPFRRMHVRGSVALHQDYGWASGGWMSDSLVDGTVDSGSQQQWISRNSEWGRWTGSNWNFVFVGDINAPKGEWPSPTYTKVAKVPIVREKPYLLMDNSGRFGVRIPDLRADSVGISWRSGSTPGQTIPLDRFFIAHPGVDSAAKINAELQRGKNLLLTPGIFELDEPIRATKKGQVVLGLGFATLRPVNGTPAMTLADEDGIIVAGLIFDAGVVSSPVLLEVGVDKKSHRRTQNPISLHDVFFRIGGAAVGRAETCLKVNSDDTIIDHTWIWRADHGAGVGWDSNTSDYGIVVNGNDVVAYGLFVEHHKKFQVVWNGERGRVYLYQSEIPYDPPNQASYTSAPGTNGWASYKVDDRVTRHEAWGLGVYSVFRSSGVTLSRAIEAPVRPNVRFHNMITTALDDLGEISHVINDTGGAATPEKKGAGGVETLPRTEPKVVDYPIPH